MWIKTKYERNSPILINCIEFYIERRSVIANSGYELIGVTANEKHRIALYSTEEEAVSQLERLSRCIIANPNALIQYGG